MGRYFLFAAGAVALTYAGLRLVGGTGAQASDVGGHPLNIPFSRNLAIGSAAAGLVAAYLTKGG